MQKTIRRNLKKEKIIFHWNFFFYSEYRHRFTSLKSINVFLCSNESLVEQINYRQVVGALSIMTRMLLTLVHTLIATTVDSMKLLTTACLFEASGRGLAHSVRYSPEGSVYGTSRTTCWERLKACVSFTRADFLQAHFSLSVINAL